MNKKIRDAEVEDQFEAWQCDACGAKVTFEDTTCWGCGADISNVAEGKATVTKDIWQQKSDEELITASEHLSDYTKGAEEIIRAELQRRRMPEPEPTLRNDSDGDENTGSGRSFVQTKLKSPAITRGIVVAIIGIALIIISPNLIFTETVGRDRIFGFPVTQTTDLRNVALFFGVALLIVGGIIAAKGLGQFTSTQPTPPPAPTTQPVVTQSVSPKSVELGNTPDEVQSVMGQPDKIINLGARVIHVYDDMKIIYIDGKVSDVQLS